jgi:hypothetical protein
MKTYKDEKDDNLAVFIDRFDDEKEKDSLAPPFILQSSNVYVYNLNYRLLDANKKDSIQFSAKKAGGNLQDLSIIGPDFSAKIRGLYFKDNRGLEVANLTTDFSYSRTAMHFDKARLQTQNSDVRVKENIVEIGDCISKVQAMRGVYYNRTDFNTEATKVGVIAQEVEAVLPELIVESPEDGLKSVAYSELTAVLINAIKEQQEIIEDLKTRVKQLENK